MAEQRLLSLVLPAYKQDKTIIKDIKSIEKALSALRIDYELIVVIDGIVDKTYQKVEKLKSNSVVLVGYDENQGKGFAIKQGVAKAKGEIIGFIDAGMDLDPKEIALMMDIMDWNRADIVVGSKMHPDSKVNYPLSRKILSWGYRSITRVLFNFNVKDTQVGLKIFRKEVAKKVFKKIVVKAFAFDVEVLAVARLYGFDRIYEAPVRLKFRQGSISSTNFWKVAFWTLMDTLAVYYRIKILHFYK